MIYIVDDHHDTARLLATLLRKKGVPAAHFGSGDAALAEIRVRNPSMVILDQMMPGLLGTDVLRAIRDMGLTDLPAIFYSAARGGEDEAHLLGAKAWLTKGKSNWPEVLDTIMTVYRDCQRMA